MTPETQTAEPKDDSTAARRAWMSLLAGAPADVLARLWADARETQDFDWLRAPETGGVMVQGRMGATGAPFNLGEMTVTRCTLRLRDCGTVGHAYVQGRDKAKAETAALIDALMQGARAEAVKRAVLDPLAQEVAARKAARAGKAAATRADFFTLGRGEA